MVEGAIKAVIEAGKGSVDFLAFALIAVLGAGCLIGGVSLSSVFGFMVLGAVIWVLCRYALLRIQSHERLRDLRENASLEARRQLEKHATDDDVQGYVELIAGKGGRDGH